LAQNITATKGDIFTISFYAKVEAGGTVESVHRSNLGNVTTGLNILDGNFVSGTRWINTDDITSWRYCWATLEIVGTDITYLQWRIENSQANKTMWITRFKLEKGNKATAWSPNPTDIEYAQMGYAENVVYDSSGHNYHGETMTTTMISSSDTPRNLISTHFNGTYDGVIINNLPLSNIINSAVTYSFWIKPESETGARSVYFGSYSGTSWSIEKSTANVLRLYWNGSPDELCTGATLTDGEWQHICITKNGTSDVKVYINGVEKWTSTAAHSALTFPTTYRIGRDTRSNDGTPYKGLMSDFRIYATALSAEDIQQLYNAPVSVTNTGAMMTQGEFVEVVT